jgi:hypothetical protein
LIKPEQRRKNFDKALHAALKLAHFQEAQKLRGYVVTAQTKAANTAEVTDNAQIRPKSCVNRI